jgi:hypothetical protein
MSELNTFSAGPSSSDSVSTSLNRLIQAAQKAGGRTEQEL